MKATSKCGDEWTGDPPAEGWWPYRDAQGRLYESREVPVYRIRMDHMHLRIVKGRTTLCPNSI